MFRCKEVAERASLLVDGELGLWPRLKMRAHLAMCGACRAFVAQIRLSRDMTRAAADLDTVSIADKATMTTIVGRVDSTRQGDA